MKLAFYVLSYSWLIPNPFFTTLATSLCESLLFIAKFLISSWACISGNISNMHLLFRIHYSFIRCAYGFTYRTDCSVRNRTIASWLLIYDLFSPVLFAFLLLLLPFMFLSDWINCSMPCSWFSDACCYWPARIFNLFPAVIRGWTFQAVKLFYTCMIEQRIQID